MRVTMLFGLVLTLAISVNAATLRVPSEYSTIQQAVDTADPGDEIAVEEGVYGIYPDLPLTLIVTKNVTIVGIGDVRIGSLEVRAADVRIRGLHLTSLGLMKEPEEPRPHVGNAVRVVGAAHLAMEDCLIRHWGFGIQTVGEARVELQRCRLEEITRVASWIGHGGSLHAESCLFQSSYGDGIVAYGAARVTGTGNIVTVPGVPFVYYGEPGEPLAIEPGVEEAEVAEKEYVSELEQKLATSVDTLDLSVRASNCLASEKIATVAQLVQMTEEELLKVRSFGKTSLREVKRKLADIGLSLGMDLEGTVVESEE